MSQLLESPEKLTLISGSPGFASASSMLLAISAIWYRASSVACKYPLLNAISCAETGWNVDATAGGVERSRLRRKIPIPTTRVAPIDP